MKSNCAKCKFFRCLDEEKMTKGREEICEKEVRTIYTYKGKDVDFGTEPRIKNEDCNCKDFIKNESLVQGLIDSLDEFKYNNILKRFSSENK